MQAPVFWRPLRTGWQADVAGCGGAMAELLRRRDCFDGGGVPGVWPDRGLVFAQSHGADVSDVPADHDGGAGRGAGGGGAWER